MARIMCWLNYRRNHVGQGTISVPSPYDSNPGTPYWYDKLASMANQLASNGITDVLFPNPLIGEGAEAPTMDGYSVFDDYDIGSKGKNTRFGNAEQLRRAIAVFHANGINVHLDHIMHQRSGGWDGIYQYHNWDHSNKTLNGRFAKQPGCFRGAPPRVPADPVPSPADDFAFGDELCPVNALPKNYVWDGLLAAGDWLFRTTGADGARLDDMKGINLGFIKAFMTDPRYVMQHKFFFGEYASGAINDLEWWINQVNRRASLIDFDFHYNFAQPMCMAASSGNFYMGNLANAGFRNIDPLKVVPFVESMDSDTNGFATIIFNKILGYALLLTGEGLPMIYIRDYLAEPDCYGLAPAINNLCWIHQKFAAGPTITRYRSSRVFVFERQADPGLIVALNNDVWNPNWYSVTVTTDWPPGTIIHDYTGKNSQDCQVDNNRNITFGVPPGVNGEGYGCWAPAGYSGNMTRPAGRVTTQVFFGAEDLDIPPININPITVGRLWCATGSKLSANLKLLTGSTPSTVSFTVVDPNNLSQTFPADVALNFPVSKTGWHSLIITGNGFTTSQRIPFELTVNYLATTRLPL